MANAYVSPRSYYDRAFQLMVELPVKTEKTSGAAVWFNSKIVFDWLKKKFPHAEWSKDIPPDHTWKIGSSVIEIFYRTNEIFCCQLDEIDHEVAGRKWTTEIEIVLQGDKVLLGVKISYTTPENSDADRNKFSVPGFVKDIVALNGLRDVRELNKTILRADSQESLEELYDLITDEKRIFPVVVITDFVGDDAISNPIVEPEFLLKSVGFISHVAYIPGDWTWQWKEMVEADWDVYNGAVRTYYKDVNFDYYDLRRHPLCMPQWINTREYKDLTGSDAFVALLIEKLQNNDKRMRLDWKGRGHKFIYNARREAESSENAARIKKIHSSAESDWENFYKEEIAALKKRYDELQTEKDFLEDTLSETNNELQIQKGKNYALTQRIAIMQKQSDAKTEDIIPAKKDCTYKNLAAWVEKYFPHSLFLTDRAKRSLKEAAHPKTNAFADVELIYKWLQFLGTEYWQMRMGQLDKNSALEKANELGIYKLDEPPIGDARRGEQGKKYYTKYNGANYEIDCHIKTGVGEPQYCLRIYYFWHDEDSVVVIADLPWHLDTRDT